MECVIKRGSMLAELIVETSLIIWDEALMTHRKPFEILDRTFRDILATYSEQALNKPFGGKVIVLGGDLRQILPAIEGGSREQIVNAAIVNSPLWQDAKILHLNQNMRLTSSALNSVAHAEMVLFAKWILDIGKGKLEVTALNDESEATWITIPDEFLLWSSENKIQKIVESIYSDLEINCSNASYLRARAILTPTNDTADLINSYVVSMLPAEERQYLSCDKVSKASGTHESYDLLYPIEFLNSQWKQFSSTRFETKKRSACYAPSKFKPVRWIMQRN